MKRINLVYILPFLLLSFTNSGLGEREAINKISYIITNGGKGGGFSTLTITKDFSVFETENTNSRSVFSEATDPIFWKRISKSDLKAFDAINSSRRTAPHDGADEEVTIATNRKEYSFVNGDYKNSKKVTSLIESLKQKMSSIAVAKNLQPNNILSDTTNEEQIIFSQSTLDIKPSFPDGIAKFHEYIAKKVYYETEDLVGNIIVSFIVEIDGSLSDIKFIRSDLSVEMTNKALQAVQNSPKWNAGEKNGKKVRSLVSIQIRIN